MASERDSLPQILDVTLMIIYNVSLTFGPLHINQAYFYHRHDPMLVLEINPVVGCVASYLCLVLGYLGEFLHFRALIRASQVVLVVRIYLHCRRHKRYGFNLWVRKIPWKRAWQPTPVFLPGESCGQRRRAGYCP